MPLSGNSRRRTPNKYRTLRIHGAPARASVPRKNRDRAFGIPNKAKTKLSAEREGEALRQRDSKAQGKKKPWGPPTGFNSNIPVTNRKTTTANKAQTFQNSSCSSEKKGDRRGDHENEATRKIYRRGIFISEKDLKKTVLYLLERTTRKMSMGQVQGREGPGRSQATLEPKDNYHKLPEGFPGKKIANHQEEMGNQGRVSTQKGISTSSFPREKKKKPATSDGTISRMCVPGCRSLDNKGKRSLKAQNILRKGRWLVWDRKGVLEGLDNGPERERNWDCREGGKGGLSISHGKPLISLQVKKRKKGTLEASVRLEQERSAGENWRKRVLGWLEPTYLSKWGGGIKGVNLRLRAHNKLGAPTNALWEGIRAT